MKRLLLFLPMILFTLAFYGQTYYVDAINGFDGNNGTSALTPWKTISKVNSTAGSGATVLFKRGQTFYGTLQPGATNITYNAYDVGAKPVISAGTTSNAWTDAGNGRYYISGVTTKPKIVFVNGRTYARGRTPDNGFWNQDAVTPTSITADELNGSNFNGGSAVVRPERWIINNVTITGHTGSTISFADHPNYDPKVNWKFFVTDDLDCVTAYGEWYWDDPTDRLYVYFGGTGTSPVTYSTLSNATLITSAGAIFRNLSFEFANESAARVNASQNVRFEDCDFRYCYDGIYLGAGNSDNLHIRYSLFHFINNNGVKTEDGSCNGLIMEYNEFRQIGYMYGEGGDGDGMYQGFNGGGGFIAAGPTTNATIRFNVMDTIGYVGIGIGGQNTLIQNNIVKNFCYLKDDGGAIYGSGHGTNKRWTGNIIIDGAVNAWQGTEDQNIFAYGLYLDNNNKNYTLDNNTLINVPTAIFVHHGNTATVRDNVVFKSKDKGIMLWRTQQGQDNDPGSLVRNLNVKNNLVVGIGLSERLLDVQNLLDADDITNWGTIDSNFYMRPLDDNLKIYGGYGSGQMYSLAGWRAFEGHDLNSQNAIKTFPAGINAADSIKIFYNASNSTVVQTILGRWKDHKGVVYNGSVSISPYRSVVLFADGATGVPPPPTTSGYVTWKTPIDANYELLPGQESKGGLRKKTTSAQGWNNGSVTSTETISIGESFEFKTTPASADYSAWALYPGDAPGGQVIGVSSILFAMRGGNTTAPQVNNGMVPHEAGADISSGYISTALDSPYFRFHWRASDNKIVYQYSANNGVSYTDFYVSPIIPNSTFYNLLFAGYDPGDEVRLVRKIGISAPINQPPTANAGADVTVQLPTNNTVLSGSGTDSDGTISAFNWAKVSGPGVSILTPASSTTAIENLVAGTYVFRLTVTDNGGATQTDDVTVTVLPAVANQAPTANAGTDQTIQAPIANTTLSGTGSDGDGTVSSYLWFKVSGPAGGSVQTPNSASTLVTALNPGTYVFRLTVTDNVGATAQDDVQITVLPDLNNPIGDDPVANAGTDSTITSPKNSVTLIGLVDAGAATSYRWEKVSGPRSSRILNPSAPSTKVDLLLVGTYKFRFNAIGASGAIASDEVNVTVLPTPIGGRYYVENVSKRIVGAQLQAVIKYTDGYIQVITANGNGSAVSSVRQALRIVDGSSRLVGLVYFADGTSAVYSYK